VRRRANDGGVVRGERANGFTILDDQELCIDPTLAPEVGEQVRRELGSPMRRYDRDHGSNSMTSK
jgi:hypothetical protein